MAIHSKDRISGRRSKMNRKAIANLFAAIFLFLAIPDNLSTTPFALYVKAWVCVPTSTTIWKNASKSKTTTISRAREWKLRRTAESSSSSSFPSSKVARHGSISSLRSSFLTFFEKPSTSSSANSTVVAPFMATPTGANNTNEANLVSKPKKPKKANNDLFFIRPALLVDMDRASKILADGFFKGPNSNWFTYQYEKFITYLSLEANFPKTQQQRSRYEIYVACCAKTGEVWGLVEIDARGASGERTSKVYEKSGGSPYMCNLVVDERRQRKGIATSLVFECERRVKEWYSDDESNRKTTNGKLINDDMVYNKKDEGIRDIFRSTSKTKSRMSNSVCLKVRESNKAAVEMYVKLGYVTVFEEIENPKTRENILLMRKELPSLSPPPHSSVAVLASE